MAAGAGAGGEGEAVDVAQVRARGEAVTVCRVHAGAFFLTANGTYVQHGCSSYHAVPQRCCRRQASPFPAQIVFAGLDIIVPLLSPELLKFPKLCRAYFALLAHMLEVRAVLLATSRAE